MGNEETVRKSTADRGGSWLDVKIPLLSNAYYRFCKAEWLLSHLFTPLDTAVEEINSRRSDKVLVDRVIEYLQGDIPEHFLSKEPIFYLSRFIATPNFETLHVLELAKGYPYQVVLGHDCKGAFDARNEIKWALGKLPVVKGISKNGDEIIEYFTLIDFSSSYGHPLCDIETKLGVSMAQFHESLFTHVHADKIVIRDESDWVDRNFRDDIFQQYKRMLALLCVHGIMFESYIPAEYEFMREVVYPAFREVERDLGVKPLIVEHITADEETLRNWNSYPQELYPHIKKQFEILKQK
jgi:hypothetical protein